MSYLLTVRLFSQVYQIYTTLTPSRLFVQPGTVLHKCNYVTMNNDSMVCQTVGVLCMLD